MANELNKRFFTNTYVTGGGRQNYLRIDHLEDPLFTSFTFDIDFVTSPLFYTINLSDYGYPNVEGLCDRIESALGEMHSQNMELINKNGEGIDNGYDILPVLSASILDGNKLGFGLQQNVYMDMPLYGAAEYIYMVDKRNGGADQNDVRFDSNQSVNPGGNPNAFNSYKLGDAVKTIVNDSDKAWAERKNQQNAEQVADSQAIMNDPDVSNEHTLNKSAMETALAELENLNKQKVKGVEGEFTEVEILEKINELKKFADAFDYFKREIVAWVNENISGIQSRGNSIYMGNKCVQKILTFDDLNSKDDAEKHASELSKEFGSDFRERLLRDNEDSYKQKFIKLYNESVSVTHNNGYEGTKSNDTSFLVDTIGDDGYCRVREKKVIDKFGDKLEYFELYENDNKKSFKGDVFVGLTKTPPDWATIFLSHITWFIGNENKYSNHDDVDGMITSLMSYECDYETAFDEKFTSKKVSDNEELLTQYEIALDEIRTAIYGFDTKTGKPATADNPEPGSKYAEYIEAKEKYENDDYSQAEKSKMLAESGMVEMNSMIGHDEYNQNIADENYNEAIKVDAQPLNVSRTQSIVPTQTVLDMLGFISGMRKMTMEYPYIIQGISGLDAAYNNHYGIKDPYLGSGDNKITLTCLESLDLRVSSMFNRYFNAVYDRQYRRERVPVNLRRFNCSVYVHDVRNFKPIDRVDKNGEQKVTYNRILELTDMYYSVVEFRFFDCEIVPEETGNIFNDVSNEAPSEMKKTNFTFTYGNCVVNFVPQSEVVAHNVATLKNKDELTRN
jgi:hypothetical protein